MGFEESLQESKVSQTISPQTEPLWTVEEIAGYLRLEPETVRSMAREGKLPAAKVGKVWRFRHAQIKEWIQREIDRNAE